VKARGRHVNGGSIMQGRKEGRNEKIEELKENRRRKTFQKMKREGMEDEIKANEMASAKVTGGKICEAL